MVVRWRGEKAVGELVFMQRAAPPVRRRERRGKEKKRGGNGVLWLPGSLYEEEDGG